MANNHRLAILIVDDDVVTSEILGAELLGYGHKVVVAMDGRTALNAVHALSIDVVLTDVDLPAGPSGLDILASIKAIKPKTRVVVMSANAEHYRLRAMELGALAVLAKPIDLLDALILLDCS